MCELNVIVIKGDEKELVMESVTKMLVDGDSIELTGIFGEKTIIFGTIKEIDFSKGETIIIGN
ncbi:MULTISPECIES: CooT family nickel-binding protein [Methanococcoides]|jgi:predicted RNA-binding protein|uniref:CooT family nickel-binding protein n=2 Tax=Methanococcoides TaxID=2225 RepID=A0A9E4ZG75_9EURY|nr:MULTISPECIES: CooT family nickel-binding protein [Methanococcoides]MCD4800089.1 CooT family nickel-binding protein [Methanococcoides sp.]MCD4806748.1 CooT family nickel-binding protein [Methanococcoides sp.]MCD4822183.1 CooT family nickel-binding protein [Methanococcoides sp.]MCM1986579.1 CooT family nickel-binding protein [Methanococcoides seepicolus]MDA0525513.1 CooT family nickel-binding protein [Methanococcoides alaskense]